MIAVDKNSSTSLHIQIKKILKENILRGKYQPDERIPSEIELAELLNVSRMTVNKVINELTKEGFLHRHPGKGTFVSQRRIDQWFFRITSFNRDMVSRGLNPSTSVLEKKVLNASKEVIQYLNLKPKEKVIFVKRLRYADNIPIMLEFRYLNYEMCKQILKESLDKESIHDLLVYKYQLPLTKVNQYLETIKINDEDSKLLGIPPGEPGFLLYRTTFTGDVPVTFVKYIYRGDRYRFYAEFIPIE